MVSVGEYITQLIQQQVETAESLINDSSIKIESRVHEVRKAMKRSSAFLQLLHPAIPETLYYEVKNRFRGISKLLAEYRKYCVYVESLCFVEKNIKKTATSEVYDKILEVITGDKDNVFLNVQSVNNSFLVVSNQLEQIPLDTVFRKSRKLTRKQADKMVNKSREKFKQNILTDKTIKSSSKSHEWRKSTKQYMYQAKAVIAINEYTPVIPIKEIDQVSELLGYDHDIAELINRLDEIRFSLTIKEHLPKIKKILSQKMMSHRLHAVNQTNKLMKQPLVMQ